MEFKRYIAIGRFYGSTNITSIVDCGYTIKDVRRDCRGNNFIPYVILTEKKFLSLNGIGELQTYEEVKHLTSNYYKWSDITDYILQCYDIMRQKFDKFDL